MEADRGSERMMQEMIDRRSFSREQLLQLIELSRRDGVELRHFFIKGMPDPDAVFGTFDVRLDFAANLVQELLRQEIRIDFHGFPLGVVAIDALRIDFESSGFNQNQM
jgi:hypothetical protein